MREADLHPECGAEQRERVVDVVAVPDEGDDETLERPESLAHREHVGQRLAWVFAQGQAVDDRDRCLRRELDGDLVRAGPDDDPVDEPLEVACHVADALARPEHDVVGQVDRVAPELCHPGLERHPRPEARLLEQHGQRPPDQRRGHMPPRRQELCLQDPSRVEHEPDLSGRQVSDTQQVPPAQHPRRGDHRSA